MSHAAQRAFFDSVKARFPTFFEAGNIVLDCGSLDVNGSLRGLFATSNYTGIDVRPGKNVDLVCKVHEAPFGDAHYFDVIVSAEMLEHDEHWRQSLQWMYAYLRSGGLLAISAAGVGRAEHGTARCPDLGETPADGIWGTSPDYYRNLAPGDFGEAFINLTAAFSQWDCRTNAESHDVYFWGLKR